MRRFNSFENQRLNSWVDEFNQIVSFINENSEQNSERYKQIKIKDPQNAIFLGESKYGPVALTDMFNAKTLITGESGSGKSYLSRVFIENLYDKGGIIFLCDPEGEWITLRQELDFVLLGKDPDECDICIDEDNITEVLIRCIESNTSAILCLNQWTEKKDRQILVAIMNELLLIKNERIDKAKYSDLTIVFDEAHTFATRGVRNDSANDRCTLSLKEMASKGRKRRISMIFVTQRPTKLHADITTQCNVRLMGKFTGTADMKNALEILGLKSKHQKLIENLKYEFIAKGDKFCHGGQLNPDEVVIFKSDTAKTPHLDLKQLNEYKIPQPKTELKEKIRIIGQIKSDEKQEKIVDKKENVIEIKQADNKIMRFEQIVSCLGSITLKNLYVLAIEKFNQVEAQFEITKWLRGNSREYIQVNDEIYAKEKNTKIKLEDAEWFLEKWKKKIDDDKYWKLIAYLFRNDNERNSLKEISEYLEITTKELNDLYLKHVGLNLIYAKETELFLNDIFFHPILNNIETIETVEDDEDDLIESFDNDFEEEFEEIDNYND